MVNGQTARTSGTSSSSSSSSVILVSLSQDLFIQTTVQYLRKKAPQLLHPISSKEENYKPIANIETINILLSVLQLALPSISNADLIQEIQTMLGTSKILTRSTEAFTNALPHHFTPSPTTQLRSQPSKESCHRSSPSVVRRGQSAERDAGCLPPETQRRKKENDDDDERKRKTAIRRALDHCKSGFFVKIMC